MITFFGIYEVPNLECLSEAGFRMLEDEIRERDETVNLQNKHSSKLALRTIYGDRTSGSKIMVRLAGRKMLSALFLTGMLRLILLPPGFRLKGVL